MVVIQWETHVYPGNPDRGAPAHAKACPEFLIDIVEVVEGVAAIQEYCRAPVRDNLMLVFDTGNCLVLAPGDGICG